MCVPQPPNRTKPRNRARAPETEAPLPNPMRGETRWHRLSHVKGGARGVGDWRMQSSDLLRVWGSVLQGRTPCPGCYAYSPDHLGPHTTLRQGSDYRGQDLVTAAVAIARRLRPVHLSIVGGEPLVRYRELRDRQEITMSQSEARRCGAGCHPAGRLPIGPRGGCPGYPRGYPLGRTQLGKLPHNLAWLLANDR